MRAASLRAAPLAAIWRRSSLVAPRCVAAPHASRRAELRMGYSERSDGSNVGFGLPTDLLPAFFGMAFAARGGSGVVPRLSRGDAFLEEKASLGGRLFGMGRLSVE